MYFILSKVLLYFIFPLTWVFILLIISLSTKNKKRKRRSFIAAVIVLYLFSNAFLFNNFARLWNIPIHRLKNTDHFNCAIVLGGFSSADPINGGHFTGGADRFIQGLRLYNRGRVSHLLITSGNGNLIPGAYKEADWARFQLLQMNVPDTAILIEDRSRNTIENARFSKALLQQQHIAGPYLLITSAFHMRRAAMIFKKNGVDFVPFACDFFTKQGNSTFDDYFIPSADALWGWNGYIKEMAGYIANYFNA